MFVAVVLVTLGIGAAYLTNAFIASKADERPTAGTAADRELNVSDLLDEPHVVFRSTSLGPTYGFVAVAPLSLPDGPRGVTKTACDRVYSVAGTGICMSSDRGVVTTYQTHLLDEQLAVQRELDTTGLPSRARISPDGRLAATTTFVTGHSYADTGFSTVTTVYDVATGEVLHDLEDFTILRDGKSYRSPDINVWGVTFAPDSNTIYATMASKGTTYLVEGDLQETTLRTLRKDIECPSVSPDGTRIAYKKRADVSGSLGWRLYVLDLTTRVDTALAEERSVDDQVEWLDDERVIYGLPRDQSAETDVWVVPADGAGTARVFIPRAWSPAVVR